VKHLSDVDCYEKETAVFECQFNYDDAPLAWFKDDEASFVQNFLMFAASIILFFLRSWERLRSIVMSCACVSVCLCAGISLEPQARSLPDFLCTLPMLMARSSFGVVAISYVLPVL